MTLIPFKYISAHSKCVLSTATVVLFSIGSVHSSVTGVAHNHSQTKNL